MRLPLEPLSKWLEIQCTPVSRAQVGGVATRHLHAQLPGHGHLARDTMRRTKVPVDFVFDCSQSLILACVHNIGGFAVRYSASVDFRVANTCSCMYSGVAIRTHF